MGQYSLNLNRPGRFSLKRVTKKFTPKNHEKIGLVLIIEMIFDASLAKRLEVFVHEQRRNRYVEKFVDLGKDHAHFLKPQTAPFRANCFEVVNRSVLKALVCARD